MLIAAVLVGGVGGAAASAAQAADSLFADGYVSNAGQWAPAYINLIQIDVRSLDGHSACVRALSPTAGYSSPTCTNDLSAVTFDGSSRLAHAFSGWSGNVVNMRARQYW